jgi:hypothetical protein
VRLIGTSRAVFHETLVFVTARLAWICRIGRARDCPDIASELSDMAGFVVVGR